MSGATYDYPDPDVDEAFRPRAFGMTVEPSVLVSPSPFASITRTVEVPGPVWVATLTMPTDYAGDRARVEAFWAKVRGQANAVRLWHMVRPVPRGTLRGSPTVEAVAVDAEQITINCAAGETLLAGDMLGVGPNLLQVTSDGQESGGQMTVGVAPPVKVAVLAGTAVVWNRPTAVFLLTQPRVLPEYEGSARALPFSVELVET